MTFAGTVTSAAALLVLIFLWAPVKGLMFTPNSGSMILVRNNVTATSAALMCYPPESTVHGEVRLAKAVIEKAPLSVSLDAATFLPEAVLLSGASAAPSPPPWEAPSAERQRAPPPIPADRRAAADKKGLSWRAKARFCLVLAVPMLIIVFVLISKPTRARAECDCVTDSRSLLLPSYPASPIIVRNSSPEERSSQSMGPPQPAKGIISIEACARPIAVDHRISLPYYFRIAGTLLRQARIYRDEKNILDLYVILLRYTSLLCETIPKHRDYPVFKSREPEFVRNANSSTLIDVLNELESLKPVVKQQIFEHNRRGTPEANGLNGIHAANHRTEKNPPTAYSTQPFVGSNNGSLQKFSPDGRHHMAPLPSVQTDRQIRKQADGEFYCAICMETVPGSLKFSVGSCGHAFCSSCVAQYVAAKLVENLTLVECPDPGCGGAGVVEPESCRGIISPDLIGKWELLLCESALGAKKVYCPYKECSAPLLADGEAAIAEAECPHCHRLFCARCAVPWHVDIECGEFQQLGQDERSREDLLLRRLAGQESWQRCPKCQMYVEKSEGCNYIKCRCGYSFCYRCASEVSAETHYCEKCKR